MPETNYFWDPLSDNILQERDETGAVTAEYTTEPGLYGNLISQNREGVESQYHFDALGSTLALTDDNQQVSDTYAYTAFGNVTESSGITVTSLLFIGQKQYLNIGMPATYYVRRRDYHAPTGRWCAVDIVENASSRFAYAKNQPTLLLDPSGEDPLQSKIEIANCKQCVSHYVLFDHRLRAPKATDKIVIIQKLEYHLELEHCEPGCDGKCKPTDAVRCGFSMYEHLGVLTYKVERDPKGVFVRPVTVATDQWGLYLDLGGAETCEVRGKILINSEVRAFKYTEALDPESGKAVDPWRPPGVGFVCRWGTLTIPYRWTYSLTSPPRDWKSAIDKTTCNVQQLVLCCQTDFPRSELIATVHQDGRLMSEERITDCRSRREPLPRIQE